MPYRVALIYGRDKTVLNFFVEVLKAYNVEVDTFEEGFIQRKAQDSYLMTCDIVWDYLNRADEIFAICWPEELAIVRSELRQSDSVVEKQPRPNVTLELGMAFALTRNASAPKPLTFIQTDVRMPSDIRGIYYLQYGSGIIDKIYNHLKPRYTEISELGEDQKKHLGDLMPDYHKEIDRLLSERSNDIEAGIFALKSRGIFDKYVGWFHNAQHVKVLGAINRRVLNYIERNPTSCTSKRVQILVPADCIIADNFDILEDHYGRRLINEIRMITDKVAVEKQKNSKAMMGVEVKFYTCFIPSSLYIFDDYLWITPYTHKQGTDSPSFFVEKTESPVVFQHYSDMFDLIWEKKSLHSILCNCDYDLCEHVKSFGMMRCPNPSIRKKQSVTKST